jgi:hypothetical protein
MGYSSPARANHAVFTGARPSLRLFQARWCGPCHELESSFTASGSSSYVVVRVAGCSVFVPVERQDVTSSAAQASAHAQLGLDTVMGLPQVAIVNGATVSTVPRGSMHNLAEVRAYLQTYLTTRYGEGRLGFRCEEGGEPSASPGDSRSEAPQTSSSSGGDSASESYCEGSEGVCQMPH